MRAVRSCVSNRLVGRLAGPLIAALGGLFGLFLLGERTGWRFTGSGHDMAGHYALTYWFSNNWSLPSAEDLTVAVIARNPPVANIVAALAGWVVDSPFRGLHLVALAALVLIWTAIAALVAILPSPRRWIALGLLAVLLFLNTPGGPLSLHVHGFEIVVNFFFAQVVGQVVVWWLVWFAVRRRLAGSSPIATAVPIAIVAVLSTFVHALPAVELLGLVGCLSATEMLTRWRAGRHDLKSQGVPVILVAATAGAIALTPGFRAQRGFAKNDGYLEVDYLTWPEGYISVAIGVVVVSIMLLVWSVDRRLERTTAAVSQGLGFVGIAIAAPCLAQVILLAAGEGSPYAVKKYAFGLLTVLAVDLCVVLAVVSPVTSGARQRSQATLKVAAAMGITLLAMYGVMSRPGAGYFTSSIETLERQVLAAVSSADLGRDRRDYAAELPDADVWLDYMFTTAILRPRREDLAISALLSGRRSRLSGESDRILTAVGSRLDRIACRSGGVPDPLVLVDADCWSRRLKRPTAVDAFPQALANPNLDYSGIYEDGWLSEHSYVVLAAGRATNLELHAVVPLAPAQQRLRVSVNGREVTNRQVSGGDLRLTAPLPASSSPRRVELEWAFAAPLPAPDRRPAAALLRFIGLKRR